MSKGFTEKVIRKVLNRNLYRLRKFSSDTVNIIPAVLQDLENDIDHLTMIRRNLSHFVVLQDTPNFRRAVNEISTVSLSKLLIAPLHASFEVRQISISLNANAE